MSYKSPTLFSAALLFGLALTSLFVLSQDLNELYPDDDYTSDTSDQLGEAVDSTEDYLFETADSVDDELMETAGSVDDELMETADSVEDELLETADSTEDESSAISELLSDSSSYALPKDVVVVLDNSGSMKKNDPDFLATRIIKYYDDIAICAVSRPH